MKKIFYKIALAVALAAGLTSCSEDKVLLGEDVQTVYQFRESKSTMYITDTDFSTSIPFGVTTRSDQDRVIPVIIDATSTADPSLYSTTGNITIPAGQFMGSLNIEIPNPSALVDGVIYTVVFRVDTEQYPTMHDKDFHVLSFMRACESDLAGMYSVTTTYLVHDFLPDYSENTMEVELTVPSDSPPSSYKVADFSGGLYSVGPYTEYGTGSAGQAANRDLVFMIYCSNQIGWNNLQRDPWGVINRTPGGVNAYDPATGVITISWTCAAYGESGVSVYTPL